MSDANRTQLGIIEESTFGTTPSTPEFQTLRVTGEPNLAFQPVTVSSNEIRSDRQVTDLILVDKEAGGNVEMEVSFNSQDDLFEGALFSDWVLKAWHEGSSEITAVTASTDTYTVSNKALDYVEYMLIEATGFTNAGNNGVFAAQSGTSATALIAPNGTVDETPPSTAVLRQVGFQGPSGDIVADATGLTSSTLDFTAMGLVVGEWIKIGGSDSGDQFATAACNGWARISSIAANDLNFDVFPTGWTTDAGTSKTIMIFVGDYLRNGTTKKSYSIERQFLDHSSPLYELFTGMTVDSMSISAESASIATCNFGFLGKDSSSSTTRTSGATDAAATTTDVMNTSTNVGQLFEGGSALGSPNYALSLTLNVANNLRRQQAIANTGAVDMGVGECAVTGTLTTYFGDNSLLTKVLNNTETALEFHLKDSSDNVYLFDLPRVKYSSGAPDVSGKNTDVTAELGFQAIRNSTYDYTIQIQRFWYTEE